MADAVSPHAWRSKKSSHSSVTNLHLPGELADVLAAMAEAQNAQSHRIIDLERRLADLEPIRGALGEWLKDLEQIRSRKGAA